MQEAESLEHVQFFVEQEKISLLYISRSNCSVCVSLLPQVENLLQDYPQVASLHINTDEIPEIAAEYSIFTVPVVIVSVEGKEMFRKARFVPIEDLNAQLHKITNLLEDQ